MKTQHPIIVAAAQYLMIVAAAQKALMHKAYGELAVTGAAPQVKLVIQVALYPSVPHLEARHCKDLHPIPRKAAVYLYLGGGKGGSKGWQGALWLLLALLYSLLQERRQRLNTHKQRSLQQNQSWCSSRADS